MRKTREEQTVKQIKDQYTLEELERDYMTFSYDESDDREEELNRIISSYISDLASYLNNMISCGFDFDSKIRQIYYTTDKLKHFRKELTDLKKGKEYIESLPPELRPNN